MLVCPRDNSLTLSMHLGRLTATFPCTLNLSPPQVGAGIKPVSIVSYNHLGNNDGCNLSAPQTFRSKVSELHAWRKSTG